jgi:hypothetical protein
VSASLETTQERRDRLRDSLAAVLDARGFAKFPKHGSVVFDDDEQLREARADLWVAIEDLDAAGRPVEIIEFDNSTVVRWA